MYPDRKRFRQHLYSDFDHEFNHGGFMLIRIILIAAFCAVMALGGGDVHNSTHTELVEDLKNDSFTTREAATTALVRKGTPIAVMLKEAYQTSNDEEQRSRIELILARIAENVCAEQTLISVSKKRVPVQEVIDAVNAQLGYPYLKKYALIPLPQNLTVSVDALDMPVLEVIKKLCLDHDLAAYWGDDHIRLHHDPRASHFFKLPGASAGPAMVAVERVFNNAAVNLHEPGHIDRQSGVEFAVVTEPKIRWTRGATARLQLHTALANNGKNLLERDLPIETYFHLGKENVQSLYVFAPCIVKLPRIPRDVEHISRIAGTLLFSAAATLETVHINDFASFKGESVVSNTIRVSVLPVTLNDTELVLRVECTPLGTAGMADSQMKIYVITENIHVRVFDGNGNTLYIDEPSSRYVMPDQLNKVVLEKRFRLVDVDLQPLTASVAKLEVRIPTEFKVYEYPFEITEPIPIPR